MANTIVAVTLTRPANITAYGSNGVGIANAVAASSAIILPNWAAIAGGIGNIYGISCVTNLAATQYTLRLHFYKSAPSAPINDNATFNIVAADDAISEGWFDMPGLITRGAGSSSSMASVDGTQILMGVQSDGTNNAYMQVELLNAFNTPAAPVSGQTFKFRFKVSQ